MKAVKTYEEVLCLLKSAVQTTYVSSTALYEKMLLTDWWATRSLKGGKEFRDTGDALLENFVACDGYSAPGASAFLHPRSVRNLAIGNITKVSELMTVKLEKLYTAICFRILDILTRTQGVDPEKGTYDAKKALSFEITDWTIIKQCPNCKQETCAALITGNHGMSNDFENLACFGDM